VRPDRDPRAVLREAGLRPKKSFGQHFLVSEPIARSIASLCVPDTEIGRTRVVEIGAGTGMLTRLLAPRARELVAIERDRELVPVLARELAGTPARVLEADAGSIDFAALWPAQSPPSPRVVCGNLPYSITGLLLRRVVDSAEAFDRAVFMVQEEVAYRLTAAPGCKERGALTVFVGAVFDVRRLLRVPAGAFHPRPQVTSAVVELVTRRPSRAPITAAFQGLVHRAFQARRKTLRNAWTGLAENADELRRAAERAGISLDARGETLEVESFARMAEELSALPSAAPAPFGHRGGRAS
jgi:16S rRNA (adenine1518-N6/adenine1519-N6)-dimethyltransferase